MRMRSQRRWQAGKGREIKESGGTRLKSDSIVSRLNGSHLRQNSDRPIWTKSRMYCTLREQSLMKSYLSCESNIKI